MLRLTTTRCERLDDEERGVSRAGEISTARRGPGSARPAPLPVMRTPMATRLATSLLATGIPSPCSRPRR
jgi:hypothetical protein